MISSQRFRTREPSLVCSVTTEQVSHLTIYMIKKIAKLVGKFNVRSMFSGLCRMIWKTFTATCFPFGRHGRNRQ
ncbi:hypothetical protein BBH57_28560 [Pseudomonas protegens]|nr:hypothetical protein BBH58_28525 [Pseudomonas protegens]OBZ21305.1 hypothetical protein BBH57_28560 [Pseudomonas protegens]